MVTSSIAQVIRILKKTYPTHDFVEVNGSDPYRILISCILSLRTQDTVSLPATQRLFAKTATLKKMAQLRSSQIAKLIYPVGFYKTKAKQIVAINKALLEEHKGKVPNTHEGLLAFKGVGRKTANLVLSLGYDIPAICVDTHVHRITNRLGWISTKTPDDTELALMEVVPKRYWIPINHVFVNHGQQLCKPRNPQCYRCPISAHCLYEDKQSSAQSVKTRQMKTQ